MEKTLAKRRKRPNQLNKYEKFIIPAVLRGRLPRTERFETGPGYYERIHFRNRAQPDLFFSLELKQTQIRRKGPRTGLAPPALKIGDQLRAMIHEKDWQNAEKQLSSLEEPHGVSPDSTITKTILLPKDIIKADEESETKSGSKIGIIDLDPNTYEKVGQLRNMARTLAYYMHTLEFLGKKTDEKHYLSLTKLNRFKLPEKKPAVDLYCIAESKNHALLKQFAEAKTQEETEQLIRTHYGFGNQFAPMLSEFSRRIFKILSSTSGRRNARNLASRLKGIRQTKKDQQTTTNPRFRRKEDLKLIKEIRELAGYGKRRKKRK